MRMSQSTPARQQWYDRNPDSIGRLYAAAGVAPHALTAEFGYTVPAGKRMLVEAALASVCRDLVATVANFFQCYVRLSGLTTNDPIIVLARVFSLTVDTREAQSMGGAILMVAGDTITGYTEDLCTGGTVAYMVSAKFTEYDA